MALAMFAVMMALAGSAVAQNGNGNFQFNELDFDRQGTGQGPGQPPAAPQGGQGGAQDPDAGLVDLFSGDPGQAPAPPAPAQGAGVQSPAACPPCPATAQCPQVTPAATCKEATAAPVRKRARRRAAPKEPEFRNMQERRFYYAMQAWRNHPEILPVNCESYLAQRPLYHVRCLGALAKRSRTP
jgi:hypothetical protein